MTISIIGIDCATQDAKIGLALGRLTENALEIERADHASL